MTTGLAVVFMALGLVGTLRAVAIVTTGGEGRFPLDPLVSIVLGFRTHPIRPSVARLVVQPQKEERRVKSTALATNAVRSPLSRR
jgi:hypothetical protein